MDNQLNLIYMYSAEKDIKPLEQPDQTFYWLQCRILNYFTMHYEAWEKLYNTGPDSLRSRRRAGSERRSQMQELHEHYKADQLTIHDKIQSKAEVTALQKHYLNTMLA